MVGTGGEQTSYSKFKSPETSDFWGKTSDFSTFWLFSVNPAVAGGVSRSETMVVGSVDKSTSYSNFESLETNGCAEFWVNIAEFSTFL